MALQRIRAAFNPRPLRSDALAPLRRVTVALPPRPDVATRFREEGAAKEAQQAAGTVGRRFRNIVLALDDSKESDMAVSWAMANLVHAGDAVHIVHVTPGAHEHTHSAPPPGHMPHVSNGRQEAAQQAALRAQGHDQAEKLVARYGPRLADQEAKVHAHVLPVMYPVTKASIAQALCEQADALSAAAVVVASTSRGGLWELLNGSVADYSVRYCCSPVVVLHSPPKSGAAPPAAGAGGTGRQLLVAVDTSEHSQAACRWLLEHVYRPGDTVHLVHVVPCLPYSLPTTGSDFLLHPGLEGHPDLLQRQGEMAEQEARAWRSAETEGYKRMMEEAGVDYTFDVMVQYTDSPVDAISGAVCSKAAEVGASVVVLSHHTQSSWTQLFTGSVTRSVTRYCDAPVVVLHAKEGGKAGCSSGATPRATNTKQGSV